MREACKPVLLLHASGFRGLRSPEDADAVGSVRAR